MTLFNPNLSAIKNVQRRAMDDLCNIYRVSRVSGTYSDDETEIVTGTFSLPCGIEFTSGQIKDRGQVLLVDYDAVLRLPLEPAVNVTDRIELIEKGDTVISGSFMVHAYPKFNSTVQIVQLKRVKA